MDIIKLAAITYWCPVCGVKQSNLKIKVGESNDSLICCSCKSLLSINVSDDKRFVWIQHTETDNTWNTRIQIDYKKNIITIRRQYLNISINFFIKCLFFNITFLDEIKEELDFHIFEYINDAKCDINNICKKINYYVIDSLKNKLNELSYLIYNKDMEKMKLKHNDTVKGVCTKCLRLIEFKYDDYKRHGVAGRCNWKCECCGNITSFVYATNLYTATTCEYDDEHVNTSILFIYDNYDNVQLKIENRLSHTYDDRGLIIGKESEHPCDYLDKYEDGIIYHYSTLDDYTRLSHLANEWQYSRIRWKQNVIKLYEGEEYLNQIKIL